MTVPMCPTVYPTMEEWQSFEGVIRMAEAAAASTGIVKIVPPQSWAALARLERKYAAIRKGSLDFNLTSPVAQNAVGRSGVFKTYLLTKPTISLQAYKALSERAENRAPCRENNVEESRAGGTREGDLLSASSALQKRFWASLGTQAMSPPLYAADVQNCSLFCDEVCAGAWDMRNLKTILQQALPEVPGVTSATLFAGMWRTSFSWHTEDYDLYALNYHHMGGSKHWYGVPHHSNERFQSMCAQLLPGQRDKCRAFLRHKMFLVSPAVIREFGVPVFHCEQKAGELVLTLPGAFHCGFNSSFNIAEACNFALPSWIPFGLRSRQCDCRAGVVRLDMRVFLPYAQREGIDVTAAAIHGGKGTFASSSRSAPRVWRQDDVVWVHLPGAPAWPGLISTPATRKQKRELDANPTWCFVLFFGSKREWAVVPACDMDTFPGPDAIAATAKQVAGRQKVASQLDIAITAAFDALRSREDLSEEWRHDVANRETEQRNKRSSQLGPSVILRKQAPKARAVMNVANEARQSAKKRSSIDAWLFDESDCMVGQV